MRVRAWVRAVQLVSGLTLAELEEEFSERWSDPARPIRSCIWNKYRRGVVVPRNGARSKRGFNLVERVEQRYPETAKWLSLPLWRLADKAPMEMGEIREIYEGMPYLFRSIFIAAPCDASEVFWRRPVDPQHVCEILIRKGDIDALVTALAMVKEAELTQHQYQHSKGSEAARRCLTHMKHDQILDAELLGDLRSYLESRWKRAKYFSIPGEEEETPHDNDNDA